MKNLTEGNIYKTFILFAIPVVLSGILSQAYQIIDSMIAGKFLGEGALASIGATSSFITLISSVFWGYSAGTALHIAVLFGAQEYKALKSSLYSNVLLFIGIAVLISIVSLIFKNPIFDFLKVDSAIRKEADIYYTISTICNFILVLNPFFAFTFNSLGMSEYPFRMSIISTVINITGNILSVTVFKIGIAGLAIASVIAALVVDICYILKLLKCFEQMGCKDYKVKLNIASIKQTVGYAVPVMMQQSIMYISSFVISPFVNAIGSSATAAYSVILKIYDTNAGIYQNSAKTLTNYTAQCMGAQKFDKIKKGVAVGLIQGIVLLAPVLIFCIVFAEPICESFFPKGFEGEALDYSIVFVRLYLPFILFNVINNLFHAFFRGVKAMKLLLVYTAIGSAVRMFATFILANDYGMHGIYSGWIISWIVEAVLISIAYFRNDWQS